MGKANRDVEDLLVLIAQLHSHVLSKGRRPSSDVHDHVEDMTLHDRDQLGLRLDHLVMQSADDASPELDAMIRFAGGFMVILGCMLVTVRWNTINGKLSGMAWSASPAPPLPAEPHASAEAVPPHFMVSPMTGDISLGGCSSPGI